MAMLFDDEIDASHYAESFKGRVTELVGKTKPIMVSQEVSDILTELNSEIRTGQMKHMAWQLLANLDDAGMAVEDAYKALANGWEIRKETLYNVKVPHAATSYYKNLALIFVMLEINLELTLTKT
ncbi:hypothetical protein [Lacticaseibacillus saniviri]|uniref:hypothetical protein n=1 Tax=Lacticaseibacillus saniviri TaxID=931533 RepID=UPI0006D100FD|nr:hypothetical protein [Lacticaseibacillus saniviri]